MSGFCQKCEGGEAYNTVCLQCHGFEDDGNPRFSVFGFPMASQCAICDRRVTNWIDTCPKCMAGLGFDKWRGRAAAK